MKNKSLGLLAFGLLSMTSIQVGAQAPHPERVYLSGKGIDDTRTWDFYCSGGQNSGKWKKIEVPCNWELQGFGEYTYGRYYTVKGQKPSDETGIYRMKFKADKAWEGQTVKIFFDGVMTDTEVLVNGHKAGETHQGGFYRFSYDITSLIEPGKTNTLEVKVAKESANRLVNAAERKADWWLYGGIYRPVWLEVLPKVHINHYVLSAEQDGTLSASVDMEGDARGYEVAVSVRSLKDDKALSTADGQQVASFKIDNGNKEQFMKATWTNPALWTTESPNLYVAKIELKDKDGKIVQTRETRIGFRTVEFFPQDGLYINGVRQVLKGVNRHSFSVDGGRATSAAMSLEDVKLIKQMNMNAVRSHYPPDEHFLDMCDSLGLVYMDELAGWQNAYDTPVGEKLVAEMVRRDVNHPCVVIWSNGNEGGWNTELDALFAKYDNLQRRHVVHPWADFNDLDTHHYPAYLTGVARFTNGYKVFMPTEFMHAMYDQGGGAGLRDFWERWQTNPMFAGGFIWVFTDEAPKRTDKGGILDSDKSNAPDGILGPRREKEGSFWAIRSQWSPIQIKPLVITEHFDGSLFVANEYTHTSLSECTMKYKVRTCATPMHRLTGNTVYTEENPNFSEEENQVIAEGVVTLPNIEPGETGRAKFALPENFREGDVLELEAFDKNGESMNVWTYPIRLARQYYEHQFAFTPMTLEMLPAPTASKTATTVTLKSHNVIVEFNAETGTINSIKVYKKIEQDNDGKKKNSRTVFSGNNRELVEVPLKDGPVAVGMKMRYEPELSYIKEIDNCAVFCAKYKGAADSIVWKLNERGLLSMDAILLNRASGGGGFDDAFMDTQVKNLGLTFSYPETACTGMKWFGRGPYRVWKNRIAGTNYAVWHKDYNNTITGESYENLVYPEFKGYHANIYWATIENNLTPFTVYSRADGLFLHAFTPQEPEGRLKSTMPAFPKGDISFLLDIPAICSFKPIEQQGPNSQPGNIRIKQGDEGLHINLTFDFR